MWTSHNECLSLGLVSSALGNILALEVVSSSFTDSMSIMIWISVFGQGSAFAAGSRRRLFRHPAGAGLL
jgi:hypothetical protein